MVNKLGFTQCILSVVTSLVAGSMFSASPSWAATLAISRGEFEFTNFSQIPDATSTSINTNTLTISKGGMANALANALANFTDVPLEAFNLSESSASGSNGDYLGLAQSQARVIGNFFVDAGNPFSFDFTSALNFTTSIDNPASESASASGELFFALLDTTNSANSSILDSFGVFGNLATPGNSGFLISQKSDNVTLSNEVRQTNFGGDRELALALSQGSLQRSFDRPTSLTLIEVKNDRARVAAPEPSNTLALFFFGSLIGVGLKARLKTASSTSRSIG